MPRAFSRSLVLLTCALCGETLLAADLHGRVRLPSGVNGAVSPAVVYVATKDVQAPASTGTAVIDQVNLEFVPRVQAIALGGSVVFRNSERSEAHNVNSKSAACNFNLMVGPGGAQSSPIQPTKPGLMRLLCDIHQQMRGYVMVCPNSLFALTDAQGNFVIKGVPDGPHKIVVWQEFCKPFTQEITVEGSTKVEWELEASGPIPVATKPTPAQPNIAWPEVRRKISDTLEAAVRAAQKPGGVQEAEQLAEAAYFEHFEASELEAAVRLYRGDKRVFELERKFREIRRPLLADVAAGRADVAQARKAISELSQALDDCIRHLNQKGIRDRSSLAAPAASSSSPVRSVAQTDVPAVLADLRKAFDDVKRQMAAGNTTGAASLLADSYFQVFHRIESVLAARNFALMRKIENGFLDLRAHMQAGMTAEDASASLDSLLAEIELAAAAIERSTQSGFAAALNGFGNSFVILTREGVEALLIVTALLMYLSRMGRDEDKRVIYIGLLVALFATALTWAALQWVIAESGMAQETIEGAAALAAAALLFYVSYWLISKSEARHWQEYLTRKVGHSISTGSKWALGTAAFLAVYREGAETILMFQPILVNPAPQELMGVFVGIVTAAAALLAVYWGLRFASVRMAVRPFFRVTGALLFALAVVFAGKGVIELQEARLLSISPLPPLLRSVVLSLPAGVRDALGIAPTVQSVAIQSMIMAGAMVSLAAVWLVGRFNTISQAPSAMNEPVTSQTAV